MRIPEKTEAEYNESIRIKRTFSGEEPLDEISYECNIWGSRIRMIADRNVSTNVPSFIIPERQVFL